MRVGAVRQRDIGSQALLAHGLLGSGYAARLTFDRRECGASDRQKLGNGATILISTVNFCVWVLTVDGLPLSQFEHHPEGDAALRAAGLDAAGWREWVGALIGPGGNLRANEPWPSWPAKPLLQRGWDARSAWGGTAQVRGEGRQNSIRFTRPERRRGAGRLRSAATRPGHEIERCWEGDSAARGCDAVDPDCSNPRTRSIPRVGGARRSRSGDRDIRSESSARSARRPSWRAAPVAGCARPRSPSWQLAMEVTAIDGISVMDQVFARPVPRRRFQELVPDPGSSRTGGDVEVDQLPPLMADQEEDVEVPEAQGLDHEEVSRPAATQLVRQEGSPALVVARPQPPPSVPPDGTVAHHHAELQ